MVVPLQRLVNQDDVQLPTMGFDELGPLQPLVVPEVTVVMFVVVWQGEERHAMVVRYAGQTCTRAYTFSFRRHVKENRNMTLRCITSVTRKFFTYLVFVSK